MAELTPGTWTLDAAHSEIGFSVRHAAVSKARGRFEEVESTVNVAENVADSTVEARIQIASISTRNADRDAHLKSADFFDAEQFPEMTFKSTSFELDGEDLTVKGDLTIKGETRPVELTGEFGGVATDPFGATRFGVSVSTKISRKDFGITWNAALETGGVMVGDKVTINIDAEYVAPQA
ncbi:YceI family protein [uncultured Rothia sp.]|uniref:YceI family protein n=1 Tax=uncultured Rothia sp. TaxID=316088 RepID=UPI0032179ED5